MNEVPNNSNLENSNNLTQSTVVPAPAQQLSLKIRLLKK